MLFTRCPDCQTTFRITEEALHKADGQVRCGRCSNVFNAFTDLHERVDVGATAASAPSAPALRAVPTPEQTPDSSSVSDAAGSPESAIRAPVPVAAMRDEAIGPDEVHAVLEEAVAEAQALAALGFDSLDDPPPKRRWIWRFGVGLAVLALGVQLVHHWSSRLVVNARAGPIVQGAYALLGMQIAPRWNVEQYQLVDWVAAAEPNARGQGNLVITARIHNRGPQAQPYPHVQLQLLDRWEAAVGRRLFSPGEYLRASTAAAALMQPGDIADAQLVVVDPGPDAYGFELDVCVESEAELACAADEVFTR